MADLLRLAGERAQMGGLQYEAHLCGRGRPPTEGPRGGGGAGDGCGHKCGLGHTRVGSIVGG